MTATAPIAIADPRVFPGVDAAPAEAANLYRLAEASLGAQTAPAADAADRALRAALEARLAGDGAFLAALVGEAPSVAVARHLWRLLEALCRPEAVPEAALAVTVFAIPVVVVAGLEGATARETLPGILPDPGALGALLAAHGALGGNRSFGLANALVAADAIDIARIPEARAWQQLPATPVDLQAAGPVRAPPALAPRAHSRRRRP